MPHENPSDEEIRALLTETRTIAVVGASSNPRSPSNGIARKLLSAGYRIIPVNPNERQVHGQKAYASLADIPGPVDLVDVFRREEFTPEIATQAVAKGARALWLQSGIVNEEAAKRGREGGLVVVMDRCIGTELSLLRVTVKR